MTTKCSRCHEDQPDGTKFCMSCGARFSYDTKRPAPAVSPEAAFAPTLATEVPTKAGTGTPAGGAPATTPPLVVIPPSAGTTPPPFATPLGGVMISTARPPAPATPAPSPTPARGGPAVAPAAAPAEDKSVVVATVSGKLVGLDARTGAIAWEHAIDNGTPQLVIAQDLVLAAVGQSLYCCDYRTGRPMWRAALSAYSPRVTMVIEADAIYAFGAGVVDAFDRIGRRLWTRTVAQGSAASGAIGVPGNVSQADRD